MRQGQSAILDKKSRQISACVGVWLPLLWKPEFFQISDSICLAASWRSHCGLSHFIAVETLLLKSVWGLDWHRCFLVPLLIYRRPGTPFSCLYCQRRHTWAELGPQLQTGRRCGTEHLTQCGTHNREGGGAKLFLSSWYLDSPRRYP